MRIAPTCGGPSYVQTVSCIGSDLQPCAANEGAGEELGEIGRLLVTLDRGEHELDGPLRRHAFRFERVRETETADDEIGARRAAAIELALDVLPFAELHR